MVSVCPSELTLNLMLMKICYDRFMWQLSRSGQVDYNCCLSRCMVWTNAKFVLHWRIML